MDTNNTSTPVLKSLTMAPDTPIDTPLRPQERNEPTTLAALRAAGRWLNRYARNVTSQTGEDGIIEMALGILPGKTNCCIEFGASDGVSGSNTYNLVANHGYRVVLIEGDKRKYEQLSSSYPHRDRAVLINKYVGWSLADSLEVVLSQIQVPRSPDLLSIDIDGADYHIWRSIVQLRPKLVLIEYNPTISHRVDFVQPSDPMCNQGSSAAALVRLGKEKAYELIAGTAVNLLFVDAEYYPLFGIPDNSLEVLCEDRSASVAFGYDGTVFLHGVNELPWHGIGLRSHRLQILPWFLRRYPPTYGLLRRSLFGLTLLCLEPRQGSKRICAYVQRLLIARLKSCSGRSSRLKWLQ